MTFEELLELKERYLDKFCDAVEKIDQLKKQLEEANMVITSYIRNNPLEKYGPAEAYCERWQVK